jgi:hypothetical protein
MARRNILWSFLGRFYGFGAVFGGKIYALIVLNRKACCDYY